MRIIQQFTTKNQTFINGTKINVKGIVLHSTGTPQPKASAYINAFNNSSVQKSVHAFIEPGGDVYQTLPWDYKAWHVGKGPNGSYNSDHIGIEMCEPSTIKYSGGANFTDLNPQATKQTLLELYKHTVDLFAYLCKQFNLNPLADGVIVSHYEAHQRGKGSGHADPNHLWDKYGLSMDTFRQDIAKVIAGGQISIPNSKQAVPISNTTYPCLMQVDPDKIAKGDTLNIRNTPNGSIINKLGRGFVVGIEDIDAKGWAKLSGGGYVYSKYLKKFESQYPLTPKTFLVEITVDSLNVRNRPTTIGSTILGSVQKGQKYTIVATFGNGMWGLLKSGVGYISLSNKYVKRL